VTLGTYTHPAHGIVAEAIRKGTLTRQPCNVCGAQKTVAHHEDYNKPLDVIWLCTRCHTRRHAEINRQNGAGKIEYRTSLLLPPDLLTKLDDYWHEKRLETRNEAIRELLAYALDRKPRSERSVAVADKPAKEKTR
jgi:hypothetical protein